MNDNIEDTDDFETSDILTDGTVLTDAERHYIITERAGLPLPMNPALNSHGDEIAGPVHTDGCDHPKDTYLGSFARWDTRNRKMLYRDVYVFPQSDGQHVCIRCSSEGSDYISPGKLAWFLPAVHRAGDDYELAFALMEKKGSLKYERNPTAAPTPDAE